MKYLGSYSDNESVASKEKVDTKANAAAVPASASIDSSGLITYKNSGGTALFTLQLPLYNGGVS